VRLAGLEHGYNHEKHEIRERQQKTASCRPQTITTPAAGFNDGPCKSSIIYFIVSFGLEDALLPEYEQTNLMKIFITLARVLAIFLFLSAALEIVLGVFFYLRTAKFLKTAVKVPGKILKLEKGYLIDSEHGIYHPVFSFVDQSGIEHKKTSDEGSYPPAFEAGESVTILYPPGDPKNAEIDSFWSQWLIPILFCVMALVEIFFGLLTFFLVPGIAKWSHRRQSPMLQIQSRIKNGAP
jgi:hypothetical protein